MARLCFPHDVPISGSILESEFNMFPHLSNIVPGSFHGTIKDQMVERGEGVLKSYRYFSKNLLSSNSVSVFKFFKLYYQAIFGLQ